jgi:hypothetical protein
MQTDTQIQRRPRTARRLLTSLILAASALLALPASGMAAETFGSRLLNEPTDGGCKTLTPPCTYVSYIHPSDPDGDPYSGGAPRDGVIVKFRIRAYAPEGGSPSVTFRLANINLQDKNTALATDAGAGPTVNVAGTGEIEEFPGRLPVEKGEHLALDTTAVNAIYNSNGNKFTYVYAPPLVAGESPRASNDVTNELLVAAVIEPDSDGDGYGDETQDSCPTDADTQQGACPQPDVTDPKLSSVSLLPKAFKGSSTLLYRLSETATLTLKVEKASKGRKVGRKCRKQTAKNRLRKRCTRYVKLRGAIKATGGKGLNQLTIPSQIGGRKLAPGKYRLVVTARDKAGNVSAVKRIGFRIKR